MDYGLYEFWGEGFKEKEEQRKELATVVVEARDYDDLDWGINDIGVKI